MQVMISKPHYLCNKCGHIWMGRLGATEYPRMCPNCKSLRWDKEKKASQDKQ